MPKLRERRSRACRGRRVSPLPEAKPRIRSRSLQHLEGARLDALQQVLWAKAMEGDLPAAAAVVRIIQTWCGLYGLAGRPPNTRPSEPRTVVTSPEGVPELRPSGRGAFHSWRFRIDPVTVGAGGAGAAGTDRAARG